MWFARAEMVSQKWLDGWRGDTDAVPLLSTAMFTACVIIQDILGTVVAAKVCSIRLACRVHGILCIRTSHDVTHARIWTDKNLFMALTIPHIVGIVARRFSTSRKFPPCRTHTDLQSCTVIRAKKIITTCCNARTMIEVNNEGMSKVQLICNPESHTPLDLLESRV